MSNFNSSQLECDCGFSKIISLSKGFALAMVIFKIISNEENIVFLTKCNLLDW